MNKSELISYIAEKNNCTKTEAEKVIEMFTAAVTSVLAEGKEVSLIGFGSFSVSHVAAKTGRNPKTGNPLEIAAYNQVKFKAGQKLKDACNTSKKK